MIVRKMNGTQKESTVVELAERRKKNPKVMQYTVEYDSTKPEETLRKFISDVRGMMSRYNSNKDRLDQIEQEIIDIEHYMEISSYKSVPGGYRLYRKLAELRRERRACKNENDLLQPIMEHFHATEVLNKLTWVQGECAKAKSAIDSRVYSVRTDVLNPFLEPEKNADTGDVIDLEKDLSEILAIEEV